MQLSEADKKDLDYKWKQLLDEVYNNYCDEDGEFVREEMPEELRNADLLEYIKMNFGANANISLPTKWQLAAVDYIHEKYGVMLTDNFLWEYPEIIENV